MAAANLWRITDAGRAALADGQNRGVREIQFTSLAVGSGSGPGGAADDARTALRTQTDTGVLTGSTSLVGRIALQATIVATAAYNVTEVGLFALIGAGQPFLAAYWTDGGRAVAAASGAGDTLVLAGVIDIQAAAADVTVTVAPALTLNAPVTLSELLAGLADDAFVRVQLAAGVRSLVGLTRAELQDLLIDPGTIRPTARNDTPVGWLECNGQAVSRATYARLFTAIGTRHGVGDGATTFTLPDGRGRALIGAGAGPGLTARVLGQEVGAETHTLTVAEIPGHSHSLQHTGSSPNTRDVIDQIENAEASSSPRQTGSAGGGAAHNNMQPSFVGRWLIKT